MMSWTWVVEQGKSLGATAPWYRGKDGVWALWSWEGGVMVALGDWLIEGFCTVSLVLVVELPTLDFLWEPVFLLLL